MIPSQKSKIKDPKSLVICLILYSELDYEIVIVDDSSPDKTAEVATQLQNVYPGRIILKQRSGKLGLGTAYVYART